MLQTLRSLFSTQDLFNYSNLFYQDLLGYKPEQTSLQQISEDRWNDFAEQGG